MLNYDNLDVDEAMSAIKEEMLKDLSESLIIDKISNEKTIESIDIK